MSHHSATIEWQRNAENFLDQRYSRRHHWRFDGGTEVVASLSSCHMLWFLAIAARRGYRVDRYVDLAEGVMGRNASGRRCITEVTLHPEVTWSGEPTPTPDTVEAMHEEAHHECFLANSVTATIRCLPVSGTP